MAAGYKPDDGYLFGLAQHLIESRPELQHLAEDCVIAYQFCDKDRTRNGKTVFADTQKVQDKLKGFVGFDYIITFYPVSRELNPKGQYILMLHELMHIKTDGATFAIRPHDTEDFRDILTAYGFDWEQKQMMLETPQRPMEFNDGGRDDERD